MCNADQKKGSLLFLSQSQLLTQELSILTAITNIVTMTITILWKPTEPLHYN